VREEGEFPGEHARNPGHSGERRGSDRAKIRKLFCVLIPCEM